MKRTDTASSISTLPAPVTGPKPNSYFTDGDPLTGLKATVPGATFFNQIQEELANAVLASGQGLTQADTSQLTKAIPILALLGLQGYAEGYQLDYASPSSITIGAGKLVSDDGTTLLNNAANITVALTSNGVNGLDTGTEQASKFYYVYAIYNPSTQAIRGLLSLSGTAPTLPSGYTKKRLLGGVCNDGSSDLVRFRQFGQGADREFQYCRTIAILSNVLPLVAATNAPATPQTVADFSPCIPLTAGGQFAKMRIFQVAESAPGASSPDLWCRIGGTTDAGYWVCATISPSGSIAIGDVATSLDYPTSSAGTIEFYHSNENTAAHKVYVFCDGFKMRI